MICALCMRVTLHGWRVEVWAGSACGARYHVCMPCALAAQEGVPIRPLPAYLTATGHLEYRVVLDLFDERSAEEKDAELNAAMEELKRAIRDSRF